MRATGPARTNANISKITYSRTHHQTRPTTNKTVLDICSESFLVIDDEFILSYIHFHHIAIVIYVRKSQHLPQK